jgi:magnesium-transporting ATPase (P-type)
MSLRATKSACPALSELSAGAAYQETADRVVAALGSDAREGLSRAEAQARLARYGRNELTAEKPVPGWLRFLEQFRWSSCFSSRLHSPQRSG